MHRSKGLVSLVFMAVCGSAFAIFPDFGVDNTFTSVGMVNNTNSTSGASSGVLVGDNWVLTAKHVGGLWFNLEGVWHQAAERINHATADISLLRFSTDLGNPYDINYGNITNTVVTLVGFGATGTATGTGFSPSGGAGVRRTANNNVEGWANATLDGVNFYEAWVYDLDGPTGNGSLGGGAVANEGGLWFGDSGGGWFDANGDLVGINSFVSDDPRAGFQNGNSSDYGDLGGGVRLSTYEQWIESNINPVPEPATMAVLGLGALAVVRRRRAKK